MKPLEERNYYELLGVAQSATRKEIRHAYREIARIYHPDSQFYSDIIDVPPSERDVEIFKTVTNAYNVLMDAEKRAAYDLSLLHEQPPEPRQQQPHFNPSQQGDESNPNERPSQFFTNFQGQPPPEQPMANRAHRPLNSGFGRTAPPEPPTGMTLDSSEIKPLADLIASRKTGFDYFLMFVGIGLPIIMMIVLLIYFIF